MGKWIHRLSEVDSEQQTAVCANCGPVSILWHNSWVCSVGRRESRKPSAAAKERQVAVKRRSDLKKKYGISIEEWDALLIQQSGRCLICRKPLLTPCVDHCHETGAVRGLLCRSCNRGLGYFGDNIERLRAAIEYLSRAST